MPEPSQAPAATPASAPIAAIDERPLDVVPGQLPIRVAERLERGDLRALQRQRARQRDVQDEGRDAKEDERRDEAEGLELPQLVVERPGGDLEGPRDRAEAAVRLESAGRARR